MVQIGTSNFLKHMIARRWRANPSMLFTQYVMWYTQVGQVPKKKKKTFEGVVNNDRTLYFRFHENMMDFI